MIDLVDGATIGNEGGALRFGDVRRARDGSVEYVTAVLEVGGLNARAEVVRNYAQGFDDLVEFFKQLAHDWRGWTGERVWESVEGELLIVAAHRGHVELDVHLREGAHRRWSARSTLLIEPGEELSSGARDLADLLADRRSTSSSEA